MNNMRILIFSVILFLICCAPTRQIAKYKKMIFNSAFGSFSIETPSGWTRIEAQGLGSLIGRIAIDRKDTLDFDYGFWSSLLKGSKLLFISHGADIYLQATKYKIKIDGYDVYITTPKRNDIGVTCIYVDSLYATGLTVTRFYFYGTNLSKQNQDHFFQVAKTLKFERYGQP